ncbi:MAG TPA: type II toxin-antitoxin system PemK/MazF family toxin [Gemmatimonadales bacterium]|nr:type II toxin-antitoxin system PemK/MazF family toxin [Gemmatimonadales bacterium]
MIDRGSIWWAELGEPRGSEPGFRRPLLVIQADAFNRSRIQTVIAAVLTTNLRLVDAPGNVLVPATASGLRRDSVANVSQLITVNREDLQERSGQVDAETMRRVNAGLRLVLEL